MDKREIVVGVGTGEVKTLAGAHVALQALQPSPDASAAEWELWFRRCSKVYAAVAEVDKGHHWEALGYWSARTREIADEIAKTGTRPEYRFVF